MYGYSEVWKSSFVDNEKYGENKETAKTTFLRKETAKLHN